MKILYQFNWGKQLLLFFPLLFILTYQSMGQSGGQGNTHIGSGGEVGVININHSFLTGSSGASPGIIITDRTPSPHGYLSFVGTNASWSGASNAAHVDGYVKYYTTAAFTFPIGNGGFYRPAGISTSSFAAPTDAAYFKVNPTTDGYTSTAVGPLVAGVSTVEYWDINGTTPANITLTWDSNSTITYPTTVIIVGWDGTKWVNIPATIAAGATTTAGTITTNATIAPNTYTVYTLGATTPNLTIAKSVQAGTINANTNFTYSLTVGNTGNIGTSGVITVKDTLQTNLSYVSGAGTGWTCSAAGQIVTCTSTTAIAVNGTSGITLTVIASQAGIYNNKAGTYGGSDPVATNDNTAKQSTSVSVTINAALASDLETTLAQPSPSPAAGQSSLIPVTVKNTGTVATSGSITEIITIPAGSTFGTFLASTGNNGWTCVATTATTATCTNPIVLVATTGTTSFSVPFIPAVSQIGTPLTIKGDVSGGGEPTTNVDAKNTSSVTTPATVENCPTISTISGNNVNPTTCSGSNGSIKICGLAVSNAGYTINYSKNGIAATARTNQTSDASGCIVIANLSAGSYTNIKVSSSGCPSGSNTSSATLTDPASPTLTASNFTKTNPTTCTGTNGTIKICGLVASTSYSTSYNKNGLPQTSVVQTTDGSGCLTVSALSSGTYDTFIVTNTVAMCPSDGGSVSLALSDPAGTTLTLGTSQNPSSCGLNDGFIQMGGLTIGTQYTLKYSFEGASQTPITFTASAVNYTLSGLTAGGYTNINVTSLGCISNSLTKSLSDPTTATISLGAKTDPTVCSGNDGTFVVSGLVPNISYVLLYTKDGFAQTPIAFTPTGASYLVNGLTRGAYTNIRVSSSGCISNSLSATLNDPSAAVISSGGINNPSACGTTNGSLSITGLVAGTTYTIKYKKNGIWQTAINYPATSSSYTVTGLTAGSYTNISVSNGGCVSNSLSQELKNPGAAVIALGTIKQPTLCGATDGSVTITGLTSGLTYVLNYIKDGIAQTPTNFVASGTSYSILGLSIGNYTGINVNEGGCISTSLVAILSNPGAPIIDVTGLDTKTCSPGNEGGLIITSLSQGISYTLNYMKNGVSQTPIPFNVNTTSYNINGLTAGTYSNITITQGSCISNAGNAVINGPSNVVAPVLDKTSLSSVCPVNDSDLTTITANNTPAGYNLTWHTSTPATASNQVLDATSVGAGTYYGTFSNTNTNCFGASSPVTVTVTPCSPDLTTTVGQPSPSPVAGQPSSIPVTVQNIGTASTTAPITAVVQIPTGTTFGTFPTNNNGWTCTTSGTTATCTNSATLAPGVSSSQLQVPFIPTNSQVGSTLTVPPVKVSGGGEPTANTGNNDSTTPITTPAVTAAPPDLTTTVGQPSPSPVAGQPSSIPVTVSNIGTGPTTGLITETVAIPAGTSFGTFPTAANNNGWSCSGLTATTASCTNSSPIASNGNSIFNVPFIPTPAQVGSPLTIPPATVSGGGEPSANNGNNASSSVTTPNVTSTNGLLTMKVFLQGPLSTTIMTTALNPNFIPLTDPYSKGTTTTGTILTANNITDWVLVELRSASALGTVSESIAALVKNDGTLLNSDGTTPLRFGTSSGNFHVAIRHRNHLGVMTAAPVAILTTTKSIDFTNPSTATYGNTATTPAQKTVGTVTAMWAGNATGINSSSPENVRQTTLTSDGVPVTNRIASAGGGTTLVPGYFATDLNLDGTTRQSTLSSDRLIITNNISTHPGNGTGAKTFLITQLF